MYIYVCVSITCRTLIFIVLSMPLVRKPRRRPNKNVGPGNFSTKYFAAKKEKMGSQDAISLLSIPYLATDLVLPAPRSLKE